MNSIVIIEDEPIFVENLTEVLKLNGFNVFSATDGIKGLALIKKHIPDLILCDIILPKKNGYWVLKMIRKSPLFYSTPFIFITAKADREDFRKAMNLGADDYLTKPFKISELLSSISMRLNKISTIKEIADSRTEKKR